MSGRIWGRIQQCLFNVIGQGKFPIERHLCAISGGLQISVAHCLKLINFACNSPCKHTYIHIYLSMHTLPLSSWPRATTCLSWLATTVLATQLQPACSPLLKCTRNNRSGLLQFAADSSTLTHTYLNTRSLNKHTYKDNAQHTYTRTTSHMAIQPNPCHCNSCHLARTHNLAAPSPPVLNVLKFRLAIFPVHLVKKREFTFGGVSFFLLCPIGLFVGAV